MSNLDKILCRMTIDAYTGYGMLPIPSILDENPRQLLLEIKKAEESVSASPNISELHGSILLAFSTRMASLAVRVGDPRHVEEALEADAIGSHFVYWKESIPILALCWHSLEKLGEDPSRYFDRVAGLGSKDFDSQLRRFASRSERDKSLEVMYYQEGQDEDGFRYILTR